MQYAVGGPGIAGRAHVEAAGMSTFGGHICLMKCCVFCTAVAEGSGLWWFLKTMKCLLTAPHFCFLICLKLLSQWEYCMASSEAKR